MIILHKANIIGTGEEIKGFLTILCGQYHITKVDNENIAYPVEADTIKPCLDEVRENLVHQYTLLKTAWEDESFKDRRLADAYIKSFNKSIELAENTIN